MNNVTLLGRSTKKPEVRYAKQGDKQLAIARTSLAVQRDYKNSEGNYDADFINLVAFGGVAERMDKYVEKGQMISVCGRIQTGSYENKEGKKVYTTEVVVEKLYPFLGKKSDSSSAPTTPEVPADGEFFNIPDGIEEELPFH